MILEAKDKNKLFIRLVSEGVEYLNEHPISHIGNWKDGNHLLSETIASLGPGNNVEVEVGIIGIFMAFYLGTDWTEANSNDNRIFNLTIPCLINQGNVHEDITVTGVNPFTKKITIAAVVNTYSPEAKIYLDMSTYPPFHFLSDSRPDKALFEQKSIKLDDLQVGDHIYNTKPSII